MRGMTEFFDDQDIAGFPTAAPRSAPDYTFANVMQEDFWAEVESLATHNCTRMVGTPPSISRRKLGTVRRTLG